MTKTLYENYMNEFPVAVSEAPSGRVIHHAVQVKVFESVRESVNLGLSREEAWSRARQQTRKVKSSTVIWIVWLLWNSGLISRMFSWLWNRRSEFKPTEPEKPVDSFPLMG